MSERTGRPVGHVWAVHTVLADEIRPTEAIFTDEREACSWAAKLSTDPGVLAASVARFAVDQPGTRRNIGMYVNGARQNVPHLSDCRTIHGGGRNRA